MSNDKPGEKKAFVRSLPWPLQTINGWGRIVPRQTEYPSTCLLSDCRHKCNLRVGNRITSIYIQVADTDKSN